MRSDMLDPRRGSIQCGTVAQRGRTLAVLMEPGTPVAMRPPLSRSERLLLDFQLFPRHLFIKC
jgi:hypothetical protein